MTIDLVGTTIIVGISVYDDDENLLAQRQIAGTITSIDEQCLVIDPFKGDGPFQLPPEISLLELATPGLYTLTEGNIDSFENPDFLATFAVFRGENSKGDLEDIFTRGYVVP